MSKNLKIGILILISLTSLIGTFILLPTIPQNSAYNHFADTRMFFHIPNFFNVISNAFFVATGALGLWLLFSPKDSQKYFIDKKERYFYIQLFFGTLLIGFASAYYHWSPTNQTLVWDRLPMTLAFIATVLIMISERISLKVALYLFMPLTIIGLFSVIYWNHTEMLGHGDIRFYAFIQYFSFLVVPVIIILFPSKYTGTIYIMLILLSYLTAKIVESLDVQIYSWLGNHLSGHTIKHITASFAIYFFYLYLKRRKAQVAIS